MIDFNTFMFRFLKRQESMFAQDLMTHADELSRQISGKKMLVIGGAGTIGSSFIKAALKFKPAKVVVADINENGLTELIRDLRSTEGQFIPDELLTYPMSFDSNAFRKMFMHHGPFDVVANFAAHKHVRSEKDIYSIEALLENNVLKAKGLLDLLKQFPPSHFFCVSTDKAANPVNIMGASKKVMEDLIMSYSGTFKVSTARFANVAFSNGSLLEGFMKRMDKGQPLSCPSDVKRFFVAPQESGEICLMACILGKTAEIYFPKLDMETDLIRFADIYPVLLRELGYEPVEFNSDAEARKHVHLIKEGKYPVYVFNSDTSGEKLYEEFYTDDEQYELNRFNALGVIQKTPPFNLEQMDAIMEELKNILADQKTDKAAIVQWLNKQIPEFGHIETGLSLDNKM